MSWEAGRGGMDGLASACLRFILKPQELFYRLFRLSALFGGSDYVRVDGLDLAALYRLHGRLVLTFPCARCARLVAAKAQRKMLNFLFFLCDLRGTLFNYSRRPSDYKRRRILWQSRTRASCDPPQLAPNDEQKSDPTDVRGPHGRKDGNGGSSRRFARNYLDYLPRVFVVWMQ